MKERAALLPEMSSSTNGRSVAQSGLLGENLGALPLPGGV